MPTKMLCDQSLGKAVAGALAPTITASAALHCRGLQEGQRFVLNYDCDDLHKGKFQREQFAACLPSMRALVPIVSGKAYHQKTMEMAVQTLSEKLELGLDLKSVERQAYPNVIAGVLSTYVQLCELCPCALSSPHAFVTPQVQNPRHARAPSPHEAREEEGQGQ